MSEALLSEGDSESMQPLMVWLDNKELESKCRVGPLQDLSRASGAVRRVSSLETSCGVQLFIRLKTLRGNAMHSTLLVPSLYPMSKRKSILIFFFSPLYEWLQKTHDLCIF